MHVFCCQCLTAEVYITSDKVMSLTAAYTVLLDQILAGEGIQPHVLHVQ